jgi:pyrrolidone-carboxylate peptidase
MAASKSVKASWLITAFEPSSGRSENNSNSVLEEIKKLEAESGDFPFQLHYLVLPFEYDASFDTLMTEVARLKKTGIKLEGILSLGEGAEEFKIETQANNLDDLAELSDNKGVKRVGQKIFKDLDAHATIPLRFPLEAFSRIRSSKSPGYYVCNHLCAKGAREFGANASAPFFGFIHVPKTGLGGMFTADVCGAMIFNGLRKIG